MREIRRLHSFFIALFFGSSNIVITVAIHLNPSKKIPATPFANNTHFFIFMVSIFLFSSVFFFFPMLCKKKKNFSLCAVISSISQLLFFIIIAITVHRDYFSVIFQLLIMYSLIFLYKYRLFISGLQKKSQINRIYISSIMLFSFSFVWLLMMGYAIVTRQEPRWIEAIFYNIYLAVLVLLILIFSLSVKSGLYRKVIISDDKIRIDDYDLTEVLGTINLCIIRLFLSCENERVNCAVILNNCFSTLDENPCDECLQNKNKVSLCPKYRNIYNRILEIKKLFESLEIGTIIFPDNKMKILQEGWKIRFFDDIRILSK